MYLRDFVLMARLHRRAQPTVGSVIPHADGHGYVRK